MIGAAGIVAAQRDALERAFARHARPGMEWALLDFPDHANVGDSAIWAGEVALLRAITGRAPCHVATWHDFDPSALRRDCPEGTVFLHGGGNLGDIWPHHQAFRERALLSLADRTVVQLPQTVRFLGEGSAGRFAAVASRHQDFHLMVRDRGSLEFARERLGLAARLVPDGAFALGAQRAAGAEEGAPLALLRTDVERCGHDPAPLRRRVAGLRVADWLEDDAGMRTAPDPGPGAARAAAFERMATLRLARGLAMIAGARAFATDRLHGHILGLLLGRPHVALDDSHGKVSGYLAAWTGEAPLVRFAHSTEEAAAMLK